MRDFFRVGVMSHFIPLRSLPEFPFRESCKWGDKSGGMKRNKGLIYASRRKRGIAPDGPVGGAGDGATTQISRQVIYGWLASKCHRCSFISSPPSPRPYSPAQGTIVHTLRITYTQCPTAPPVIECTLSDPLLSN